MEKHKESIKIIIYRDYQGMSLWEAIFASAGKVFVVFPKS